MSCPICGHTMQNFGVEGKRVFWCQRCGTLKEINGDFERIESPLDIERILRCAKQSAAISSAGKSVLVTAEYRVQLDDPDYPKANLMRVE